MSELTVRDAREGDLDVVAAIYDHHARHTLATFDVEPRPVELWRDRLHDTGPGLHLLVAELDGEVVGYAGSSTYRPRPAYGRTRETSVYRTEWARGRGVGRALYDAVLDRLRADGMHVALAVIALPNDASESLHRACRFERVGVLPEVGYKLDRWVDTALWSLRL